MRLDFKTPVFEDKENVLCILQKHNSNSVAGIFGSYFLWALENETKMCVKDGILYVRYDAPTIKYEMPKGALTNSELKSALEFVLEDSQSVNSISALKFTMLSVNEARKLEGLFPGQFEIFPVRDDFEYIYSAEDLAELKGRKYHSKRNHISKFTKKYNWIYEPLDILKKDMYVSFFEEWFKSKKNSDPNELVAINKTLKFYEQLGMSGGTVVVDGKIVACTIGESLNSETFVIHFEKALPEFAEAYAVINNQFCKDIVKKGYRLVNREEDLGIEGLRKAKLSYHPYMLIEKYDATMKKT